MASGTDHWLAHRLLRAFALHLRPVRLLRWHLVPGLVRIAPNHGQSTGTPAGRRWFAFPIKNHSKEVVLKCQLIDVLMKNSTKGKTECIFLKEEIIHQLSKSTLFGICLYDFDIRGRAIIRVRCHTANFL